MLHYCTVVSSTTSMESTASSRCTNTPMTHEVQLKIFFCPSHLESVSIARQSTVQPRKLIQQSKTWPKDNCPWYTTAIPIVLYSKFRLLQYCIQLQNSASCGSLYYSETKLGFFPIGNKVRHFDCCSFPSISVAKLPTSSTNIV